MANALDIIKVKYGQKTGEVKTISYLAFLNVEDSYLSEKEKKVQEAMKKLHHLNENNPPLFNAFPNWRPDKPLTIDMMIVCDESSDGSFSPFGNYVYFNNLIFDGDLILTLVHELKHAEDCTKEYNDLKYTYRLDEGLAYHQIRILLEARARGCELAVVMLDCLDKKKSADEFMSELEGYKLARYFKTIMPEIKKRYEKALTSGQPLDAQEMQQLGTLAVVPNFIGANLYKKGYFIDYNNVCEIMPGDKGLQQLPTSFGILPQYREPLLHVLHASFKNGKPEGMIPLEIFKKLNVELDLTASFYEALEKGLHEDAKALIQAGLDINQKDNSGWTLFHNAALYGKVKIVQFLLKAGADKNVKNNYGNTPMHFAAKYGNIEVVKLLLEAGADKNVKNNYGNTPMHFAAIYGNIEVVKLLLKAGVDLSAKNNYAETPLDSAYKGLIEDQKEKDESKKLKDKERQDLLLTISYLEKQKAPHGRYLKARADEIRKQNKKQLKEKDALYTKQMHTRSLVVCGIMSVASFILGATMNILGAVKEVKEGASFVSRGVHRVIWGEQSVGAEQKAMPETSLVDATLLMLKDKNLDAKKKTALVLTTLLLVEKGENPTPEHLQEVLKDPSVKALFDQSELGKSVIRDVVKTEKVDKQAKSNASTAVRLKRQVVHSLKHDCQRVKTYS